MILWCTNGEPSEQQDDLIDVTEESYDNMADVYRRTLLDLPTAHKRPSLRPVNGKQTFLTLFAQYPSLRLLNYFDKRRQRNIVYNDG